MLKLAYSQRKSLTAANPKAAAKPAMTSSGCAAGNVPCIEPCIACTPANAVA